MKNYLLLILGLVVSIDIGLAQNMANVAKSIPEYFCNKINVNSYDCSNLKEQKTLEFCDESFSKFSKINEYLSSYLNNDQIVKSEFASRKKSCIELTVRFQSSTQLETIWKLEDLKSSQIPEKVFIAIEECPKKKGLFPLFNCSYDSFILDSREEVVTKIIDIKSAFVVLNSNRPLNYSNPKVATNRYRFIDGKNRRFDYLIKPVNVPSLRNVSVTQCYKGGFSHSQYEIDFGLMENESVASVDMGVVVQNYQGSGLSCYSYSNKVLDMNGSLKAENRFRVYWYGTLIDQKFNKCKEGDCSVTTMPWYCSATNSGNRIVIAHPNHSFSEYVHLTRTNTLSKFGDVIDSAGVPIGKVGRSGWIDGAHLHFEMKDFVKYKKGNYDFFNFPTFFNTKNYGEVTWPCSRSANGKYFVPAQID